MLRAWPLLVMVLCASFAVADDNSEISRLVKQLGSDDFDTREQASKRLDEIGDDALDALHKAAAEFRRRSAPPRRRTRRGHRTPSRR